MMALSVATALLAGCGGGGGGGSAGSTGSGSGSTSALDASISFAAVDTSLFAPVNTRPLIAGIDPATARCSVSAGSLPPGVKLASDCALSGTPTAAGNYDATVALSADGKTGSVSAPVSVKVAAPSLSPVTPVSAQTANQSLQIGTAVDGLSVVTTNGYVPVAGDTLAYTLTSGSLPSGLVLDPAKGTVSGTPNGYGTSTSTLALTIQHGDTSYQTPAVSITLAVVPSALTFSYPNCCVTNLGVAVAAAPTSSYVPGAGASTRFSATGLPPGVSIDGASGVISGSPTTPGFFQTTVDQTVSPAGSAALTARTALTFTVSGAYPLYQLTGLDAIQAGQSFSFDRLGVLGALPGDTYSTTLEATAGSSASGNQTSTPVPAWLHLDPSTGRLYGTNPPAGTTRYQYQLDIVLRIVRSGVTYSTRTPLFVSLRDS